MRHQGKNVQSYPKQTLGMALDFLSHPEILVEGISLAIAGVVAFIRLEGRSNALKDKISDNVRIIEKMEVRIEKIETRHDVVYAEVRSLLTSIQKSLANLEGRLGVNSRKKDDDY